MVPHVGKAFVDAILSATQHDEADIYEQRDRIRLLKEQLQTLLEQIADQGIQSIIHNLTPLVDLLVKKSVWIIGGDGWAYDIGFGSLDHVLASGRNVNVLVLDTEVYSNTSGQMSKATPRGAVAKFAASGKPAPKKDLRLIAMTYDNVYVASMAMGARDEHTLKAFLEAEAYEGPSLIITYSHCIAHGIDMRTAMQNQKAVVDSSRWLLYRYHPDRRQHGENPLQLDSHTPKILIERSLYLENRFKMLIKSQPEVAKHLLEKVSRMLTLAGRWFTISPHNLLNPVTKEQTISEHDITDGPKCDKRNFALKEDNAWVCLNCGHTKKSQRLNLSLNQVLIQIF